MQHAIAMHSVRDALRGAWATLMPVDCAGCDDADHALCAACVGHLVPDPTTRSTPAGLPVVTALRYEGPARRVLLALKEQQRTDVAPMLAPAIEEAIRTALDHRPAELVLIPASRASYRRRGYHPVAVILTSARLIHSKVLVTVRATAHQKSLDEAARADNVRGALLARRPLTGRVFLIVDDILTTGATLDEAARAIRAAGGSVLGAAALAFTPRLYAGGDFPGGQDYGGVKRAE